MALKKGYRLLRGAAKLFTPRMRTIYDTPFEGGPCVLCPNHARAWGPIGICVHFDYRDTVHPWYNAGVIDRKGLPAYVRNDTWWNPKSPLAPLYNATVPYLAAAVMPPVIRSTPGIPVYYDTHVLTTFRDSLEVLKAGEQVVIFAQFPNGYESHAEELSSGFLNIAPFAWRRLGLRLKFYPVHVDEKERTIRVMEPFVFDPEAPWEEEKERLLHGLSRVVRD